MTHTLAELDVMVGALTEAQNDKMDTDGRNGTNTVDYVIQWKAPTANDRSWYRKYKSGWVEQGGIGNSQQYNTVSKNVTFSIQMQDTNYACNITTGITTQESWQIGTRVAIKYVDGLDVRGGTNANSAYTGQFHWEVKGMAAS